MKKVHEPNIKIKKCNMNKMFTTQIVQSLKYKGSTRVKGTTKE